MCQPGQAYYSVMSCPCPDGKRGMDWLIGLFLHPKRGLAGE